MSSSKPNQQPASGELSPKRTYFSTLARSGYTAASTIGQQSNPKMQSICTSNILSSKLHSPKKGINEKSQLNLQNHFTYSSKDYATNENVQVYPRSQIDEKPTLNSALNLDSLTKQHFTYTPYDNQLVKMAGLKCHTQESFGNPLMTPEQKGNSDKGLIPSTLKPNVDGLIRVSGNGLQECSQSSSITQHDLSKLYQEFQQQSTPKILVQQEATPGLSTSPSVLRNQYFQSLKNQAVSQAQVKILDDSEHPKMFDARFQQSNEPSLVPREIQSSGTLTNRQNSIQATVQQINSDRDQQVNDSFNQRQKEKARAILSNLQSQISYEQFQLSSPTGRSRMIQEFHKVQAPQRDKSTVDSQRNESSSNLQNSSKSSQTMFNARKTSPTSKNNQSKEPQHGYLLEYKTYFEEQQKKEQVRKELLAQKELQGFTGRPEINQRSRSIKRKVDDLMEWGENLQQKREEEQQKRVIQEKEELKQFQKRKVVNKESERLLEYKRNHYQEKVEDRLMRDASRRFKKKQENSMIKSKSASRGRSKSVKSLTKSQSRNEAGRILSPLSTNRPIVISNGHGLLFNNSTETLNSGSVKSPRSEQRFVNSLSSQSLFSPILSQRSYVNRILQSIEDQNRKTTESSEKLTSPSFISTLSSNTQKQPLQSVSNQIVQPQLSTQKLQPQLFKEALLKANQLTHQNQETISQITKPTSNKMPKQQRVKKENKASQHLKRPAQYESLFDKVQRICNTSNTLDHNDSNKSSTGRRNDQDGGTYQDANSIYTTSTVPVVSATIPQIFQQYHQTVVQKDQKNHNPIYQSIKQECTLIGGGNVTQSVNQALGSLLNHSMSPIHVNINQSSANQSTNLFLNQLTANQTQILAQLSPPLVDQQNRSKLVHLQDYTPTDHISFSFNNFSRNQNQENVIIKKILESPYIPSGNINQLRCQKSSNALLDEDPGHNARYMMSLDDCELRQRPLTGMNLLHQNFLNVDQLQIMQTQSTNMFNLSDKLSQMSSLVPMNSNEMQLLQAQQHVNQTNLLSLQTKSETAVTGMTMTSPTSQMSDNEKRQIQSQKHQGFIDRNQKWVEVKHQKLEKVKQIVDSRQSRECPFRPQIISNAIQASSHKSVERELQSKSRSRSKKKTTSPVMINKNTKEILQQEIKAQSKRVREKQDILATLQPILREKSKKQLVEDTSNGIDFRKKEQRTQYTPSSASKRVKFREEEQRRCEPMEKDSFSNLSVNQEFSQSKMESFMSRASEFSESNHGLRTIKVLDKIQQAHF